MKYLGHSNVKNTIISTFKFIFVNFLEMCLKLWCLIYKLIFCINFDEATKHPTTLIVLEVVLLFKIRAESC